MKKHTDPTFEQREQLRRLSIARRIASPEMPDGQRDNKHAQVPIVRGGVVLS